MEYRPESEDVVPPDDATDHSEYLAIKHATEVWKEPKYPVYNSVAARLRSFTNWPKPSRLLTFNSSKSSSNDVFSQCTLLLCGALQWTDRLPFRFYKKDSGLATCVFAETMGYAVLTLDGTSRQVWFTHTERVLVRAKQYYT
jgi:hypothetical protein